MTETSTREAILVELYNTRFVENYARSFCGAVDMQHFDDIVQELYSIICEIPEDRLTKIYAKGGINSVRRYVSGIITRQLRSTSSTIFKKYTWHSYREQTTDLWDGERKEI